MKYLFITDDPEVAAYVDQFGIDYVFVDLEQLGKQQRQGGHDTVISCHSRDNIPRVRDALRNARLMVRLNPLHAATIEEIDFCISSGADILMLPMFRSSAELARVLKLIGGRVPMMPLVETSGAVDDIAQIVRLAGIEQIHVGLNDLRLDLGLSFLFESVANGVVDGVAATCLANRVPFGVGGIARAEGGLIPGRMVLGEYLRLGAEATILSRDFHHRAVDLADLQAKVDFPGELERLRAAERQLRARTPADVEEDRVEFQRRVTQVVQAKRAA